MTAAPLARGVAYDPATNRWRWLAPMAYPRSGSVAVWADDQLVVWGGIGGAKAIPPHGETYDPVANEWSALPRAPLRARVEAGRRLERSRGAHLRWHRHTRTGDRRQSVTLADGAALTPGSVVTLG